MSKVVCSFIFIFEDQMLRMELPPGKHPRTTSTPESRKLRFKTSTIKWCG